MSIDAPPTPVHPRRRQRLALAGLAGLAAAWAVVAAPVLAAPVPPNDVAEVYAAAGLRARDGAHFLEGCASPLRPQAEAIGVAPGVPGVLVYVGVSTCFPETQGGNVALFVKDGTGRWVERFEWLPGVEVIAQPTSNLGWADLGVANPGGCMPVYRYDGSRYRRHSQKALQPGGCQFRE